MATTMATAAERWVYAFTEGDPASVAFCARAGLDYVSASPYRVPLARLAAAQAHLGALDAAAGRER
ncbi:MAG TPA: putative PEP-binding protein, partial [Thermomicrobiales bacterium]|nr:putative PEP-binding protein [Thermomicrobiales bacterium]